VIVEAKAVPKIFIKCGKQFTTKQQLQKHHRVVHENIKDRVFCEICGKEYATKYVLKGHMMAKHDFQDYDVEGDMPSMNQQWDNVRNMHRIMKILDDGKVEEPVGGRKTGLAELGKVNGSDAVISDAVVLDSGVLETVSDQPFENIIQENNKLKETVGKQEKKIITLKTENASLNLKIAILLKNASDADRKKIEKLNKFLK